MGFFYTSNLIPVMTSNTVPSGVAFADNFYVGQEPYKMFDKIINHTNSYVSNGVLPLAFGYEFINPTIINKITVVARSDSSLLTQSLKDFAIQSYNDVASTWTTLKTIINEIGWTNAEKREYVFDNSIASNKYRIYCTNLQGGTYLTITEMEMMGYSNCQLVSKISDMNIGDRIPCRYTSLTTGTLGLFSELGNTTATATPIPTTSSATPDGSFNFIHAGFTNKGEMKLIADRNIQSGISWDVINTGGIASGSGVDASGMMANSFTKLADPSVLPLSQGNGVAYSPDGNYMAIAITSSPFILIYKKSGDAFTLLPNPSILPTGIGYDVSFSNDNNYLTVVHDISPFITIYKISANDTFTKLANPSTLPTGTGRKVAFSNDNNYMSIAHYVSPFITIYKITTGDVFTKLTNPSTLPTGSGQGIAFSSNNNYMSVAHLITPFVTIYKITTGDVFTKLANPSTLPTADGNGISFSKDVNYMSVAHTTTPFVSIYKITSGDIFTKLANPSTLPMGIGYKTAFSNDNKYMSVSHATSPFISIYKIMSSDVFIKLCNPNILPTGQGNGVVFSYDNNYMSVAHAATPFVTAYKLDTLETATTKTLRLLTGGTSATDFDNEWDKIIVGSTLNGNITSGDNNVWNWSGVNSWSPTTGTTSANRISRGNALATTTNAPTGLVTTTVATTTGFRPMMLVELPLYANSNPLINSLLKTFINNNKQIQLTAASISDVDLADKLKYQVTITKPDSSVVVKRAYDTTFQNNPMAFSTLLFDILEFDIGINTITIDATDDYIPAGTVQSVITVTKALSLKSLLQDGIKWKYINGNVLTSVIADYTTDTIQNKENAFLTNGMGLTIGLTPVLNGLIENRDNFKIVINKAEGLS